MRRAASRDQLELPGLAPAREPASPLPEPQRAAACARCGWFTAPAATCPMCQHRSPDRPR